MSRLVNENSKLNNLKRSYSLKVIFITHETMWSSHDQTDNLLTLNLTVAPVLVAISLDELWFGMKG